MVDVLVELYVIRGNVIIKRIRIIFNFLQMNFFFRRPVQISQICSTKKLVSLKKQ